MKRHQVNRSFTEAASQRAKRQMKTRLDRLAEKGQARACMINPRFSEKPRLSENDGAVLDIKKRIRRTD